MFVNQAMNRILDVQMWDGNEMHLCCISERYAAFVFHLSVRSNHYAFESSLKLFYSKDPHYFLMDRANEDVKTLALFSIMVQRN